MPHEMQPMQAAGYAALANASGVSRNLIAMIETGKKNGSVATVKKLARALAVELEDLA